MASFIEKSNVKVAASHSQLFDLSHKTITTQDFSVLTPVSVKEVVPGDHFKMKVNSFVRLAPLPCPTYGEINLVTRAFYVPYRLVFKGFDNFITGTPYSHGQTFINPKVPIISPSAIFNYFISDRSGYTIESGGAFPDFTKDGKQYFLTIDGKRMKNLLVSLGYQIYNGGDEVLSLLPLLAYAKIYYDWYYPSQFVEASGLKSFFENPNLQIFTVEGVEDLLSRIPLYETLEKDYFTTAFLEPYGNPSSQNTFSVPGTNFGFSSGYNSAFQVDSFNPNEHLSSMPSTLRASNDYPILGLTQYGLDTLKAVDQVVKRNQITGNRYNEQQLARYGVKIDNLLVGRSEYLGFTKQRVSIGEVMSTSDTSSLDEASNLGDYAGRGVASSFSDFNLHSDEFGIMMCLSCLQVTTGYPQGIKRELVKHIDRFDFFTPEFDTLGTQPISYGELYAANKSWTSHWDHGKIFGWSPRYSEYKCSFDVLSGDFLNGRYSVGMDSWHLFRDLSVVDKYPELEDLHPDMSFLSGNPDSHLNNFGRIFTVDEGQDHFICVYDVNISAHRNMKSLSDSMVTDGTREVTVGYNGSNF